MIKLYTTQVCPYCEKVKAKFKELNMKEGTDFKMVNAAEPENRQKLLELGGKMQVPFMVDGSISMYESDDIIEYAEKKFK